MTSSFRESVPALWRMAAMLSASLVCIALSGCGNGLSQVSGLVTLDGQPLRGGSGDVRVTIQFQPADGVGANAIGLADENGNYEIATGSQSGIRPGDYVVTCSVSRLGQPKISDAKPDPKFANARTSGLTVTVTPGKNEFNIPLTSSPKTPSRTARN